MVTHAKHLQEPGGAIHAAFPFYREAARFMKSLRKKMSQPRRSVDALLRQQIVPVRKSR
jgi:hypothetical protein